MRLSFPVFRLSPSQFLRVRDARGTSVLTLTGDFNPGTVSVRGRGLRVSVEGGVGSRDVRVQYAMVEAAEREGRLGGDVLRTALVAAGWVAGACVVVGVVGLVIRGKRHGGKVSERLGVASDCPAYQPPGDDVEEGQE